jgi:hypothetical protein
MHRKVVAIQYVQTQGNYIQKALFSGWWYVEIKFDDSSLALILILILKCFHKTKDRLHISNKISLDLKLKKQQGNINRK